jgi:citrate synthase
VKELAHRAFRWLAGFFAVIAAVWGAGWGGAIAFNAFFDSKTAAAEMRVEQKLNEREAKIMAVRTADFQHLDKRFDVIEYRFDKLEKLIKESR